MDSICLSVSPSVFLSVCLSFFSMCLSVLSFCLSICWYCLSVSLSVCMSACLLPACLLVCLSACPPVYPSVCHRAFIFAGMCKRNLLAGDGPLEFMYLVWCTIRKFNWWSYCVALQWLNFRPFPSKWLNFTSRTVDLYNSVINRIQRNLPKCF